MPLASVGEESNLSLLYIYEVNWSRRLFLLCYVALNPISHFPPTLHIFHTSLRLKLTFFILGIFVSYIKFFLFSGWFMRLVRTPEITYYCSLYPSSFFISNRHSLDASDTIITHIRVKSADVKFLQTSFVLSWLLQYFECTQPKPWMLDADFDTCQLHFGTLHTIQASVL